MSKNINLVKSDIGNLFEELESVARETKLEEKKRKLQDERQQIAAAKLLAEKEKKAIFRKNRRKIS